MPLTDPVDPAPLPADPALPLPEPPLEDEGSLADHEAEFGTRAARAPGAPADAEPGDDASKPAPARNADGTFTATRHRAKSQEAGARDVPRISELSRRIAAIEAERDAIKAERDALKASRAAPADAAATGPAAARPADAATAPAKPKLDNFQEYGDYVEALADWKIAEARRQDRETAVRETEARQLAESWKTRVDGAKTRYEDFEQVALLAPTTIPQGSLVDAWILEDSSGPDVLYSLQKDPVELRRILALPIFEQVKALSLLAQRLSPTREPAVRTGAAATTPRLQIAPRPPTPVRTSAMPAADAPPGDDASVSEHEKAFGPHRR